MKERPKKDRRIRTSTAKFLAAGAVIGIFVLTFSFAYAWGEHDKQIEERAKTDIFMTVDARDFDGKPFTNEDLAGTKLVAYNVWETTCPACIHEMGALEQLSEGYDPSEFRLIGVCADIEKNGEADPGQLEKAGQIIGDAGVTYTNIVPDRGMMDFFDSTIAGFPTTFFVDSEGRIIDTKAGANDYEGWKAEVDGLLQKMD